MFQQLAFDLAPNSGTTWLIGVCLRLVFYVYFLAGWLFIDWQEKNADTRIIWAGKCDWKRSVRPSSSSWSTTFGAKMPRCAPKDTYSSMDFRDERTLYHSSTAAIVDRLPDAKWCRLCNRKTGRCGGKFPFEIWAVFILVLVKNFETPALVDRFLILLNRFFARKQDGNSNRQERHDTCVLCEGND